MSGKQYVEKVAIVGGAGHIGSLMVKHLLDTGKFTVTALTRNDSKATFADGVKVARVDYSSEDSLVEALRGQDFLIITLGVTTPPEVHTTICSAAAKAGITYVMPNIYGYDFRKKIMSMETLYGEVVYKNLADVEKAGINYVVLSCGFWYEWSLAIGEAWFGFDIKNRTATLIDDGNTKINASTWEQCGRAVAALLTLPIKSDKPGQASIDGYKNNQVFVSSFLISQRDMLDSLNRVKGLKESDWDISFEKHDERYKRGLEEMKAGDRRGFARAMYTRLMYPNGEGDYETGGELANGVLGLPKESLDEATGRVVHMVESGWKPFN